MASRRSRGSRHPGDRSPCGRDHRRACHRPWSAAALGVDEPQLDGGGPLARRWRRCGGHGGARMAPVGLGARGRRPRGRGDREPPVAQRRSASRAALRRTACVAGGHRGARPASRDRGHRRSRPAVARGGRDGRDRHVHRHATARPTARVVTGSFDVGGNGVLHLRCLGHRCRRTILRRHRGGGCLFDRLGGALRLAGDRSAARVGAPVRPAE